MNYQVKTWKFGCDECGKTAFVHSMSWEKPEGWGIRQSHGWGATNYTKDEDLCDTCYPKWVEKQEIKEVFK